MKARHLFFVLSLSFLSLPALFGQKTKASKVFLSQQYHIFENQNAALNHENFFATMGREMGLSAQSEMVFHQKVNGNNGTAHFKFKQYHEGLPVFGNTYILHEKNGSVFLAGGQFTPFIEVPTEPGISPENAVAYARQKINAEKYEERHEPPALCFIDPAFPNTSEVTLLAYEVEVHSEEPFDKQRVFVDAHTGRVISQFPILLKHGVPSTAETKYYGMQEIITDSLAPDYFELHDPTRGDGIRVGQVNGGVFTNESSHWDLTNADMDEVALDAHYCTQQYYDMMLADFDWEGLDGEGGALLADVHLDAVNAFWDGERSTYGDGSCIYGPLTTLEVVGHEFTHGMIDYTSNLIYSGESGAMNESMADIMGKTLEWHSDPTNFDWDLGHSFILDPSAKPFRVMDDPASLDMPDYYKGSLWIDNNGVHTNSAIGNLWFTMLVDGREDTNEAGIDYNVPSIGIHKASQIAFLTNRTYLTESSNYNDFYFFSLMAAEELYGSGAAEIAAVEEAWKAVGLPNGGTGGLPTIDLSISQPFVVEDACILNDFIPITIEVANVGMEPYLPSFGAEILLTTFILDDYTFTLNDTILPGEVYSFTVDDWLILTAATSVGINVDLLFNDEVPDNNFFFKFYNVSEYTEVELSSGGNLTYIECFSPTLLAQVSSYNNSCATLPAGSVLEYEIRNLSGTLLWSESVVTAFDVQPFRSYFDVFEIELPGTGQQEELFLELVFADDDPLNNTSLLYLPLRENMEGDYLNTFDEELFFDPILDASTISSPITPYQGESYLGTTGLFQDYDFFTPCPEFEDNFGTGNIFNGISTVVKACVDLSEHEGATLSFDLIQFQNDSATITGNPLTCILKAAWYGTESNEEFIFGQDKGELYHYDFDLPANFKGEFEFEFYTELGDFSINSNSYDLFDVMLFDNLMVETFIPSSTGEANREQAVKISPNPTTGYVNVYADEFIENIELYGMDGRLLENWKVGNDFYEINMNGKNSGIYLLKITNENGTYGVQKLVKIN